MLQTICLPNNSSSCSVQRCRYGQFSRSFRLHLQFRRRALELDSTEERVTSLIRIYGPKQGRRDITFETAEKSLNFFLRHGFEFEDVCNYVRDFPRTLAYDTSKAEALFKALSQIGLSQNDIKTLIEKYPQALSTRPDNLLQMSGYFQESLLTEKTEFIKMLIKRPSTLTLSTQNNVIPTCEYFLKELKIEAKYLKKMVLNYPQLLAYSLEQKIKPNVQYLVKEMGVPQEILSKKIRQKPAVLGLALISIKRKIEFIRNVFDFSDEELTTFLCRGLAVLNFSEATIEKKIKNLSFQFDQSVKDCGLLFLTYPQLIGLSLDRVNEKIHFLITELDRDLQEISDYPVILGYSVETRIKPRLQTLRDYQISPRSFGLSTLFAISDEKFEKFVKDVAERIELDRLEERFKS